MDESQNEKESSLIARIQQLEQERDELRKDIEQLCIQQAGPSYLGVATRMHFQRTAALEQEIENLRKNLTACKRENMNLREELSEAYNIKGQLADLHSAEVSKNIELERQLKFFQGSVAASFAERDNAIIEAEKAKEKEELMSRELNDIQQRFEELASALFTEKILTATLQNNLEEQERDTDAFKKVVNKFYDIREESLAASVNTSWEEKCECLLHDSAEMWSFHDDDTSKYISALEEEVGRLRQSLDSLQNKLRVGLDIENHLKKKVHDLENKRVLSEKGIKEALSSLSQYYSQHKISIMNLLHGGYADLKSTVDVIESKIGQLDTSIEYKMESSQLDHIKIEQDECRDVHVTMDSASDVNTKMDEPSLQPAITSGISDVSEALAQALQEKVAALLLLSQEEERHLLEKNINAALQKKIEELQRNLLQVTNEKVKALLELAQLKQEHQALKEKVFLEMRDKVSPDEVGEKRIIQDGDGKLKNLLKKTYLRRWVGAVDSSGNDADTRVKPGENHPITKTAHNMDFARMKIENATLKESLESMEHLTSSVHRLRVLLLKIKETIFTEHTCMASVEDLDQIVSEANLLKTALSSSLPVSWSADSGQSNAQSEEVIESIDSSRDNVDFVSAAGFEMVELLIFAAQLLKEIIDNRGQGAGE